jgi:hypothetical protein
MAADEISDQDSGPAPDAVAGGGEAGQRAGAGARPSLTIDLTAEDVSPASVDDRREPPASATGAGGVPPPADAGPGKPDPASAHQRGSGFLGGATRAFGTDENLRRSLYMGAAGGVIALVAILLLQAVGVVPSPGRAAARRAAEQATAASDAVAALDRRLSAVEAMTDAISGMRQDIKALTDKVTALDAIRPAIASRGDLDTLAATVTGLGKRFDALPPAATRDDLNALADRLGKLEAAAAAGGDGQTASSAALTSLASQITQAEAEVRTLSDRIAASEAKPAGAGGQDTVRAVALASLRRASGDGKPFAADVDMVASLGIGSADIAVIRPLALKGVATSADLAAGFPAVADAILAASAMSDADAGFVQRALAVLGNLIQVRPVGPVAGGDPAAIVSRMSADAKAGDLAAALTEREALPPAAKTASAEWAAKAADRVALDQAVERIASTGTAG